MKLNQRLKRLFMLMGCLLLGTAVLSACGGEAHEEIAVQYLDALNSGDLDAAAAYACEERADDIVAALMDVSDPEQANVSFMNVSCRPEGEDVSCRFTITQETEAAETTGQQFNRQVVFQFEDDRICGFEEEIAE